jgi:leucyl-tRNA synthetase
MMAPFAPHLAEELWERLGHEGGIFDGANWPLCDEAKATESTVLVAIQVNGKLRGTIGVPKDAPEEIVVGAARVEENVARHLRDLQERRVIYVKDRLVNFVAG